MSFAIKRLASAAVIASLLAGLTGCVADGRPFSRHWMMEEELDHEANEEERVENLGASLRGRRRSGEAFGLSDSAREIEANFGYE